MPINTATITPASLKAKEVATEGYVDTAVSNMTITESNELDVIAKYKELIKVSTDADSLYI